MTEKKEKQMVKEKKQVEKKEMEKEMEKNEKKDKDTSVIRQQSKLLTVLEIFMFNVMY